LQLTDIEPGTLGPCPVAPDSLQGIKRQQTNPARWNGPNWDEFAAALRQQGIELRETAAARAAFATDARGTAMWSRSSRRKAITCARAGRCATGIARTSAS